MTQATDQPQSDVAAGTDLVGAIQQVLQASPEPLTLSKIRAALPAPYRHVTLEELGDTLQRQVSANTLWQYPKYRSQQDRYWDRPMPVHVAALLREALAQGPLPWSELRRKLPGYAAAQAEVLLPEEITRGNLHKHPKMGRGGERYGLQPAEARDYLRAELATAFRRLEGLGFTLAQLRAGALEVLHDDEWSPEQELQQAQTGTAGRTTAGSSTSEAAASSAGQGVLGAGHAPPPADVSPPAGTAPAVAPAGDVAAGLS